MVYQAEDRAKVRRQQAEAAIQLALQGRWDEAADLNRSIIGLFPTDVDAYNRLGKAMTELGRYGGGREAYQKGRGSGPPTAGPTGPAGRVSTGETSHHPSQLGKLSFPPTVTETFRPYLKERLIRQDALEESYYESDDGADWDTGPDTDEAEVTIHKFGGAPAVEEEEELGESEEEE